MPDTMTTKYKVELDLVLHWVPPMDVHSPGFVMTRTIELPFPPYEGLSIFSPALDDCPDPQGMRLKDIVWDFDRQVFLASTRLISRDLPIVYIPDDIYRWVELGWRIGSYQDAYGQEDEDDKGPADKAVSVPTEDDWRQLNDEEIDGWRKLPAQKRPARYNQILRGVVRLMAATYNNWEVAYAMDKTKRLYTQLEEQVTRDPEVERWLEARHEFFVMSLDDKLQWKRRVESRYPRLDRLAES
jgi:hypothetical protein